MDYKPLDPVPVIDLFSGPGGLAEGFCPCSVPAHRRRYNIVLSVENEQHAHSTLLLRAFLRQFHDGFPPEYYDFLNHNSTQEPSWEEIYPAKWSSACKETKMLKLGDKVANASVWQLVNMIKERHGNRVVLVGGPPCQAYSVVGRSRNSGNKNNLSDRDPRIYLYKQYIEVMSHLQPAIAVMENVQGIISSKANREEIFPVILNSLRNAGGSNRYRLFGLSTSATDNSTLGSVQKPPDFIVRAEEYGVPQTRHRVFIVCIRSDLADDLPREVYPKLSTGNSYRNCVNDVLGEGAEMRSGLSRCDDPREWKAIMCKASEKVERSISNSAMQKKRELLNVLNRSQRLREKSNLDRTADDLPSLPETLSGDLRSWLFDSKLERLPNNETRGHMPSDLERYLYATIFAEVFGRSPKTIDFPDCLASKHKSWASTKFTDRFRVQLGDFPAKTITSHIAKDGHYFIHPDPTQCRSLTVREAARIQTFPDNYLFKGNRTAQYVQVGNAVPPFLAKQIADCLLRTIDYCDKESLFEAIANSSNVKSRKSMNRKIAK